MQRKRSPIRPALLTLALLLFALPALAQGGPNFLQVHDSLYTLKWNGTSGTLQRGLSGLRKERTFSLYYLYTAPGPSGYSRHLAWFLARSGDTFDILWCYLDNSGKQFYCWLYDYAVNQISTVDFRGSYRFDPLRIPPQAHPGAAVQLRTAPAYSGPVFTYKDWHMAGGKDASLSLKSDAGTAPLTLHNLQVNPLLSVQVQPGNGWQAAGWQELHALATDSAGTPYYLILYSNTSQGYAINLKTAQTWVANYQNKVKFQLEETASGVESQTQISLPTPSVSLFTPFQISLHAEQSSANPWLDTTLEVNLIKPDGRTGRIAGFWDGGDHWIIRIAPDLTGTWEWSTVSNDPGLNNKQGSFRCDAGTAHDHGYVVVDPAHPRHFSLADGTPLLPQFAALPVFFAPGQTPNAALANQSASPPQSLLGVGSYVNFEQQVTTLMQQGFNRLAGNWLLNPQSPTVPQRINEGGSPFIGNNPDHLNPAFFQWMDRRIAVCNQHGICPDLGLGTPGEGMLATMNPAQIDRFWKYVVARYSAYNLCWNLLCLPQNSAAVQHSGLLQSLLSIVQQDDPNHHPITTLLPAAVSRPVPPAAASSSAATPPASYVVSPAGLPLWPSQKNLQELTQRQIQLDAISTPQQELDGMNLITLSGGDLLAVTADQQYDMPVVMQDRTAPADVRRRLWETLMRGGYYAPDLPGMQQNSQTMQWFVWSSQFLHSLKFQNLHPHNDMLQPEPDAHGALPKVWMLANPGLQYALYFTKGGTVSVDLLEAAAKLKAQWYNPRTGQWMPALNFIGGKDISFSAPDTHDWALMITRA